MHIYDLRRGPRRTSMPRRTANRRTAPYPFGSSEWIENVKKNYMAWPKSDRRDVSRRSNERRWHLTAGINTLQSSAIPNKSSPRFY